MTPTPDVTLSPNPTSWIDELAKLTQKMEGGRKRPLLKDEERKLPPGTTFAHEEIPGAPPGAVFIATSIPSSARGVQFSLPSSLSEQLAVATGGRNATTALIALADAAMDDLDGQEITFEPTGDGEEGRVCSWKTPKPGTRTRITLTAALPGYDYHRRTRILVPEDVRYRIERAILLQPGQQLLRFTGVVMALAQWKLADLKKRKKRLLVLPPQS